MPKPKRGLFYYLSNIIAAILVIILLWYTVNTLYRIPLGIEETLRSFKDETVYKGIFLKSDQLEIQSKLEDLQTDLHEVYEGVIVEDVTKGKESLKVHVQYTRPGIFGKGQSVLADYHIDIKNKNHLEYTERVKGMSKEVAIKLDIYKTIEYGEDLDSIEEDLIDILEENGYSAQIYESDVQEN